MRLQSERENSSAIPTAGEIFPDGAVIEEGKLVGWFTARTRRCF
jgi:hypothetical protein